MWASWLLKSNNRDEESCRARAHILSDHPENRIQESIRMTLTADSLEISDPSVEGIQAQLEELNVKFTANEIGRLKDEILKRPPTLTECILFSIEGSEHCSYKSSRNHLRTLTTDGPNVIIGAKEDAGIVAVAEDLEGLRYGVALSHESHNHPSQIVPYEGAATGVGGNVRDVCCMGAEVIAVADSLRFGEISSPRTKWISDGVVAGIAGYGNSLGIPNLAGDIFFDEGYQENCLVTIVTLGIVREDEIIHSYAPPNAGDHALILVGKATDNSGFGGANFASFELEEAEEENNKGAVQEPNAFLERHLLKASYALFDALKIQGRLQDVGFKDLGAGGIACASVEIADNAGYGAEVWLEKVHTSMNGLYPGIILCSETQERFLWVAPPDLADTILDFYNKTFDLPNVSYQAEARVIGRIRSDGQFVVRHHGEVLVDAAARLVTQGFSYDRPFQPERRSLFEPDIPEPEDYNSILLELLGHENIASREPIFETYDKQVQGRTVVEAGPGDAGVLQPFNDDRYPPEVRSTGIALSTDHNPRYCRIDPYWGTINAVVEAVRNVASVGASPQAVTDCLCFGNPEKPAQMADFVASVRALGDACKGIHLEGDPATPLPIVAGNVSFYNESQHGAIPASPMIGCLGRLDDAGRAVTFGFKKADSIVLLSGERRDECGGSIYYALHGQLGANLPKPNLSEVANQVAAMTEAIANELVLAAHDISEGGFVVALAEMTFHRNIGCHVELPGPLRFDRKAFSESGGFLIEASPEKVELVKRVFSRHQAPLVSIGRTTETPFITIEPKVNLSVMDAKDRWIDGLREKLY